jgi:hypothetical protein
VGPQPLHQLCGAWDNRLQPQGEPALGAELLLAIGAPEPAVEGVGLDRFAGPEGVGIEGSKRRFRSMLAAVVAPASGLRGTRLSVFL